MFQTVRDVALRAPATALPDQAISEAEQQLISHNTSEIYVIDTEDRLLGVVSDHEILRYRLMGGDGRTNIAALMSPVLSSLELTDNIESAARLLKEHEYASLPVVQQGRLIGQLGRLNLLRIMAESGNPMMGELLSVNHPTLTGPKFAQTSQIAWAIPEHSRARVKSI
ncbi:CBS domain-containing protein [Planctomicrobium sp. SH527]|uniref:CBS domain-containing protein n=1 Tax=Planctomicrobium sp. SH527 TaxID=3448123 RepID=UPI003F5C0223